MVGNVYINVYMYIECLGLGIGKTYLDTKVERMEPKKMMCLFQVQFISYSF